MAVLMESHNKFLSVHSITVFNIFEKDLKLSLSFGTYIPKLKGIDEK